MKGFEITLFFPSFIRLISLLFYIILSLIFSFGFFIIYSLPSLLFSYLFSPFLSCYSSFPLISLFSCPLLTFYLFDPFCPCFLIILTPISSPFLFLPSLFHTPPSPFISFSLSLIYFPLLPLSATLSSYPLLLFPIFSSIVLISPQRLYPRVKHILLLLNHLPLPSG